MTIKSSTLEDVTKKACVICKLISCDTTSCHRLISPWPVMSAEVIGTITLKGQQHELIRNTISLYANIIIKRQYG